LLRKLANQAGEAARISRRVADRGDYDFSQEREAGFADERSLIGEAATGAGAS